MSRVHASSASSAWANRSARQPKPSPPSPIVDALEHQGREPDAPAAVHGTDLGAGVERDVVEEDLVEVGLAGDLAQRAHRHALGVHRDDEHRQALVLRHVGVRAGEEQAERRVLRVGRPHLLAREAPGAVGLPHRAGLDAGEVGARGGLGEQLAPHLVGGQHRPEVALLLVLRAVGDQRRPEHAHADDVEDAEHARAADLLVDDDLMQRAEAGAAVLGRPRHRGEAALGEPALPAPAGGDRLVVVVAAWPATRACAPPARPAPWRDTRPAPACR